MRRPFRTARGPLLVATSLVAAGAWVLGLGRGPDVTYAASAHVAIARTQSQERAMAATATTQLSPSQLAGDYLAALGPAAVEISKVTAALKALSITATVAQVRATVKPLGSVLSPLDRLQGLPAPGAGTSGPQTNAIKLPERLGPFEDVVTVVRGYHRASATARQAHMERDTSRLTVAAYGHAYPGAAVAYRGYANASLEIITGVVAVRAPSPGLTIGPVVDPADLGLAVNETTVESYGNVSCVVTTVEPAVAGQPANRRRSPTANVSGAGHTCRCSCAGAGSRATAAGMRSWPRPTLPTMRWPGAKRGRSPRCPSSFSPGSSTSAPIPRGTGSRPGPGRRCHRGAPRRTGRGPGRPSGGRSR